MMLILKSVEGKMFDVYNIIIINVNVYKLTCMLVYYVDVIINDAILSSNYVY